MNVTSDALKEIFKQYEISLNCDELRDDINLYDQGVDSVDTMSILLGIEERLGIKISDNDASELRTINDFLVYINEKIKLQQRP